MKIIALILVLGSMLALGGCTTMRFAGHTTVRGSRNVSTQQVAVDGEGSFRLEISGFSLQHASPLLTIDERLEEYANTIVISVDDNLHEHINVEVRGNTIHIRADDRTRLFPSELRINTGLPIEELRIGGVWFLDMHCTRVENFSARLSGSARGDVRLGEVDRLELTGSGSSRMTVHAVAQDANVTISGSGRVTLTGEAETAEFRMSGSGRADAFAFATQSARVNVSGSGRAEVNVQEELDARVSGSGRVIYDGNPRMNQQISGSGRINAR